MHAKGYAAAVIRATLVALNQEQFTEPKPETEIDAVLDWVLRQEGGELSTGSEGGGALEAVSPESLLERLGGITGRALLDKEFKPLVFLVAALLAKGNLAMLGGRAKGGKSWLLLQLAKAIDKALPFLGHETRRGRVLFIALEDGARRIQQRLKLLKWQPEQAVFLFDVAHFDDDGVHGPGVAQIEVLAPEFDLIIIDTLIATLSGRANENDNTQMATIVNKLAQIAHESDCAVILSHHTGKGGADDIFLTLRGASSLRGAYDLGMVLERKQGEREAILHFESRDLEIDNLTIRQSDGGAGWECLGGASELPRIRAGRAIVTALQEHGDGCTVAELAAACGKSEQTLRRQLQTAEKRALVVQATEPPSGSGKPAARWWLTEAAGGNGVPADFGKTTDTPQDAEKDAETEQEGGVNIRLF
jgi:hypothetical protein